MATSARAAEKAINRRAAVESAVASFRLEGLEPDEETRELLEAFSSGKLSIEEFGAAIERHGEALELGSSG